MAYELPPLPYDYKALEPYIDEETMHLHHDKHHQAYVNNLNAAMQNAPANLQNLPAHELMARVNEVPENIRQAVINNGGGHSNHSMFWVIMTPGGPRSRRASSPRPFSSSSAPSRTSRLRSTTLAPSSSAPAGPGS